MISIDINNKKNNIKWVKVPIQDLEFCLKLSANKFLKVGGVGKNRVTITFYKSEDLLVFCKNIKLLQDNEQIDLHL